MCPWGWNCCEEGEDSGWKGGGGGHLTAERAQGEEEAREDDGDRCLADGYS